jgi:hypothetical protein
MINIDDVVNYETEYRAAVEKATVRGDRLTGLCPFHKDKNASFSVNLKNGCYTCFACGVNGNYTNFVAEREGISTKDAYRVILDRYGIKEDKQEKPAPSPYSLAQYAKDKGLPVEWLTQHFSLGDGADKDGTPYVKIPYIAEDGKQALFRKRYGKGAAQRFKWSYGSAGKLVLYGIWRLEMIRSAGRVVIVEGESDTQTLWRLGIPALGVPGATTYKPEWTQKLEGLRIYLHIEPDRGGETFRIQMINKLREGHFTGEVLTWSCGAYGVKDPSDLFLKYGDAATDMVERQLDAAQTVDIYASAIPEAIAGAPIQLRQPEGFIYNEKGISAIDEKTAQPRIVCRTPIILKQRLKSIETGEEKIEIAFKRDEKWNTATFPRSMVFQSRSITALADLGCTVTSENAKPLVRFLEALEAENIDILDVRESTSTFGWQTRDRFLPGHDGGLVLDIDPSLQSWAAAYCQRGSLDAWIEQMRPHRSRYKFRFILAAAFTAPLLRVLRQRIFFVYNWGGSKGGKTAALKAALSAWGDPERLMVNFNATQVALERMAGFFCDLPLGIDERQLAGSKQEQLEKIVYMLASGTGRARGSKTGGLQQMQTWRTVCLATGEEPIGQSTSMTGVNTRMIEVVGGPFDKEGDASEMHQKAAQNCGWAGQAFVGHILSIGEEAILEDYNSILAMLKVSSGNASASHIASVAAVATADLMIGKLFFGDASPHAEALEMASLILGDIAANELPDVNENAVQFIADWIKMNEEAFSADSKVRYGSIAEDVAFVYPTALREALEKAGFSYRKTMKYLADEGIIQTDKGVNTIVKKVRGRPIRVVAIDLQMLTIPMSDDVEVEGFDDFAGYT